MNEDSPDIREGLRNAATMIRILENNEDPTADVAAFLTGLSFMEHSWAFVMSCHVSMGLARLLDVDVNTWVDEFIRRIEGGG